MIIMVTVLVMLSLLFCIYLSYTDIKYNRIKNRVVLLYGFLGTTISFLGYFILAKNLFWYYIANVMIAVVLAQIMYAAHIWAAGDSKMYICMSASMPIIISMYGGKIMFSSLYIITYAFLIGFVYLAIETIVLMARKEIAIDINTFTPKLKLFIFRYCRNIIILSGLWAIEYFLISKNDIVRVYTIAIANLCILMIISLAKELVKNCIAAVMVIVEIVIYFTTGMLSIRTLNYKYYLMIVLLMVFKILIENGNYKVISSSDVKKGMILSTVTTLMMANSTIEGLPGISRENMGDRLTEEEAEAVQKWGKIRGKSIDVQILKKVPFAVFLTLGMIADIVTWGIISFANR